MRRSSETPWAMESLGELYLRGHLVAQDYTAARAWLQKAADRACPKGQFLLSEVLIKGLGCPKALEAGVHWLRLSAAQGFEPAKDMLNKMQIGQQAVPPNP